MRHLPKDLSLPGANETANSLALSFNLLRQLGPVLAWQPTRAKSWSLRSLLLRHVRRRVGSGKHKSGSSSSRDRCIPRRFIPYNTINRHANPFRPSSPGHRLSRDLLSLRREDSPPHIGRAFTVYHALKKTYGTSNAQYTFALGRRFIENRVHGVDSVGNWVNEVKAQHRELKSLSFDLDALCVNVLLNGLPDRFSSYVDNVWTNSETPTIDSVSDSILRIDAGHQNRDRDNSSLGHNSEIVDSVCDTVLCPDAGHHKSLGYSSSSAPVDQNLDTAVMVPVDDTGGAVGPGATADSWITDSLPKS
ncbi:hypothetical protein EHS25_000881 [Saitozyma podzolica]|uniref:Uncharacterized protein n=1 Tax=Saitozyma podzolica TaxID=1890683 RepID=A0A427YXI5_9TREE|nr:hypothetical protein EHS25_000881 [Saitozyma podzolica]